MKLKHWAGYGTMNAKKTSLIRYPNGMTELKIRLSANHEQRLDRDDAYDVAEKLVKRFDKAFADWREITSIRTTLGEENGVETCDYTITYITPLSVR